jgi:hypothetical protein
MNSEIKKIVKTKDEVIRLLTKYPEHRDNDERLIATFWNQQLKRAGIDSNNITGFELLKIYSNNEILTSGDVIVSRSHIALIRESIQISLLKTILNTDGEGSITKILIYH